MIATTSILLMMLLGGLELHAEQRPQWTYVDGGVTRGDASAKKIALIFTGGDFGEGTGHVLDTLAAEKIKASFFFTGDYLRKPEHAEFLKRIIAEDHYLGPHSD